MPNRRLNFFRAYQDDSHEDQLTRAALVVMRLVPLAHLEFLRLIDPVLALTSLPPASFDTQTHEVHPELSQRVGAGESLNEPLEVISVFLTPDDAPRTIKVAPSDRKPRFDGALRFGESMVVLIESKLDIEASHWQAEQIPLGNLRAHSVLRPEGVAVKWHDLLEAWMQLDERGLFNVTEKTILADFFDLGGQEFSHLLPFRTLERAADNDDRIQRRIHDLLQAAINAEIDWDTQLGWWYAFADWQTFARAALVSEHPGELGLHVWPGQLLPQARAVYKRDGPWKALAALNGTQLGHGHACVRPDLFLRNRAPRAYIPLDVAMPIDAYLSFWSEHVDALHQYSLEDLPLDWLVAEEVIGARTRNRAQNKLVTTNCSAAVLYPALSITVQWPWSVAVELDDDGSRMTRELREAFGSILAALGEQGGRAHKL